jgi:prepilin-type N-terminal cleavage/methylation domain-containing protein
MHTRQRKKLKRGFSLLEIVVAIAIVAMISAAITVAVMKHKIAAERSLTATNAQTIRLAVKSWWIAHDSASCPTVRELVADGEIERGKVDFDAWGQAWLLKCDESDVTVSSKGQDKTLGTDDDIHVPSA